MEKITKLKLKFIGYVYIFTVMQRKTVDSFF